MRTLLLADDSITVQRVIALTFADGPVRVVSVSDGQQAIERMAAQRPDIVLAGTTLPQVNGYDLAKFVRSNAELKHVPVLLLSGAFETVDEARLKSSGANGVIEKPVEPNAVINRVKELLGLKSDPAPAPAAGRLITSAAPPADRKPLPAPTPPRAVTNTIGSPSRWEQLRNQTLEPHARPVEDAAGRDHYMDSLDAAFDTLDQHLAGKGPARQRGNPAGPLGQSPGAADPRSPGRRPADTAPPNPVFEVDDEWFSGESKARDDARAGRREMIEDLSGPEMQKPAAPAPPSTPIYEVDDEWFKEDDQVRAAKVQEQRMLAAEMGIHEVELPEADPAPASARTESGELPRDLAPAEDLDFNFGLDDLNRAAAAPSAPVTGAPQSAGVPQAPEAPEAPKAPEAPPASAPVAPIAPPVTVAPAVTSPAPPVLTLHTLEPDFFAPVVAASRDRDVADDFAALLAFETGERSEMPAAPAPAAPPPPVVHTVAPEITDDMLDQIAARVADRLNAGLFGEQLRQAMTATVRDTVRSVVADTSERLVRDEIERIKSKNQT